MVDFRGVGQLLGAQAFTGGQLQGLAAGQQETERRRQQEFLNFFRVQQAQQQATQFQEQQAFRQQMFERQFGLQEQRFGLDIAQADIQRGLRERGLDIQEFRARAQFGAPGQAPDIADLIGPRLTEEQARIDQVAQLRLEQRRGLADQPPGFRAAPQPRFLDPDQPELGLAPTGIQAAPQPGLPTDFPAGVRAAPQPTLQALAPRLGRRRGELTRQQIIKLSVKAGEGDRAAALTLANAGIGANIFGDVRTPELVAGAKEALKERGINFSQATQREILDALQPPLGRFRRGLEVFKGATVPFGVPSGINVLREQTGFTQPLLRQNLQQLQKFLTEIRHAPREVLRVQADDIRFATLLRDRLLQFERRFARAEEFDVSLGDIPVGGIPVVGPQLEREFEGLRRTREFFGERFGLAPFDPTSAESRRFISERFNQ